MDDNRDFNNDLNNEDQNIEGNSGHMKQPDYNDKETFSNGSGYNYNPYNTNQNGNAQSDKGTSNEWNNNSGGFQDIRNTAYYTENHAKKTRKKNFTIVQLIAVAVACSIISSTLVGGALIFASPIIQPAVNKYVGKYFPGVEQVASYPQDNGIYKKVEIEKTDSPVTAVAEKVGPSIVGIRVISKTQNSIFNFGTSQGVSEGSGIIIRENGYILTNYHVIAAATDSKQGGKVEVVLPKMKDKPFTAQIIGSDWRTDLAVLKIDASSLPVAEFGNSDDIKVGELAIAIGNPAGLELMGSVTTGIVSGLDRTIPLEDIKDLKLIQTDASINPGNSGGALVNSKGQVVGINNAKMGGEGYEGLGFAIPINKAKEVTDSLIEFKYVKGRPLLGITPDSRFTEVLAKQYNVPMGVMVADVHPLSGAYKAGIKIGDIITKIDGIPIKNRTELDDVKNKKKPGDSVNLEVYRDGKTKVVDVELVEDTGN